jgi:hypothetical protein
MKPDEKRVPVNKKSNLALQHHDTIVAHILDPENSPLPERLKPQFDRVVTAALLLDQYHPTHVSPRLMAKYKVNIDTARRDVRLAIELFKTRHEVDWDFYNAWQVKDLVETIRICKNLNKQKERIAAHKVLREILGEPVQASEDPRRQEKNVFYIQLNNNNTTVNIDLNKIKDLPAEEVRVLIEELQAPIPEDAQIEEMFNT